jgi:hypothetical protein
MWFRVVLTTWLAFDLVVRIATIEKRDDSTRGGAMVALVINSFFIYGIWNWV